MPILSRNRKKQDPIELFRGHSLEVCLAILLTTAVAIAATLLAFAIPTYAASKSGSEINTNQSIWLGYGGGFHNWRALSRDELIIWASPSKPYLVKIHRPFKSLRFVHTIGISSTTGRVTKFDNVIVDGQRLPIKSIVALDRETAKSLKWTSD